MFRFVLLLGVTLLYCQRPGGETMKLDPDRPYMRAGPFMQYCIAHRGRFEAKDIAAGHCPMQPVRAPYPSFGITGQDIWLELKLSAPPEEPYIFEAATGLISELQLTVLHGGHITDTYESTITMPPAERLIPHIFHQFPLRTEHTILRVRSHEAATLPIFLWKESALPYHDRLRTFAFGLLFGLMFVMAIYNFFIYLTIGDRAYLYYFFYITFMAMFTLVASGYILVFWPTFFQWPGQRSAPALALLASSGGLLYTRSFLLLARERPLLSRLFMVLIGLHALGLGTVYFTQRSSAVLVGNAIPILAISLILVAAVTRIRDGYRPANIFLMAWGLLLIGVTLFIFQNLGIVPGNFFTQYLQYPAMALETIILSLALGYRINLLQQREALARQDLLQRQEEALRREMQYGESVARFVPRPFLYYLEKENILAVEKGQFTEKSMAVLFTDIRNFTTYTESLGSQRMFHFLNLFHDRMAPIVEEEGGFIDKFIGDAIMALFPESRQAIAAALRMAAIGLSVPDSSEEVVTGAGIHYGPLVLGTVGSDRRLETTVIGDTVNLASRVESMNKVYGTRLIVSDRTLKAAGMTEDPGVREIDAVRVKGKKTPVVLFELFGADPEPLRLKKGESRSEFQQALVAFKSGLFEDAKKQFQALARKTPADSVVALYVRRLEAWKATAPPGWDGISETWS
ncbi:MAG: hypothetical protein HS115_02155 [Spirochaetales bacterium]|nr:hypothetical protein [Spirochaetales bacterium]